jgi:hypothetical protein
MVQSVDVQCTCHVLFAFDVGYDVELDEAEQQIDATRARQLVSHRRRAPAWFQYEVPPLRIGRDGQGVKLAAAQCVAEVNCTLFDFGAISVSFRIPVVAQLDQLVAISEFLYEDDEMLAEARRQARSVIDLLGPVGRELAVSEFVEDYVVFSFGALDSPGGIEAFVQRHANRLTAILLADSSTASAQQVRDCLATRLSYGSNDMVIVHWNGSLVFDAEPEDVLLLLEHANVMSVELRYLDRQLDGLLENSRAIMGKESQHGIWPLLPRSQDMRQLAEVQVDSAMMFEGMNNAIKLIGDQYLARVYRLVAEKFHLPDWDANVRRKLDTANNIFAKINDQRANRRIEVLEIIIIVLILIEVVRPFIPWVPH